ncbi:MAG: tRNA (guanine-N(1)-)-methyltransferase [Candidatus Daviesbacteria bacterium GW2011_GWA1_41_61]|uniref:tRNA (guanine-N(1)-)-methyltransferase n=1 Tax=Candidatus Daviesbacteria bacterium GW2011_GWA2_40_9 TaxID=1618424 RepID=A0A0G0WHM2_9BACT|nr:MAG: tRNA (guanine-N1)-methyltransferase, tRNA (guanine-N1-)-methyltransferase [Candidatus Daviesbacteria bacterium GW2011_GWC1_40_9]KKR83840.1 MAG: tRNA (guanine-N(1)-)-methyltransferase [Candidatus Daviesbacteria bacterium GW2011_GWA2_40_9]KKR93449.1 MAG: tRNA (guanine-N(1)-)-methyltransferase [Candidatus Daviesbacteria bacterium GW2011_GWB1_41_15]KKS15002.1 MAG: tRNA (guanine-N(1)-)-methyltransferase [Candidatus Daviesbacteria bacterium GW2011_GWA1_41_61]
MKITVITLFPEIFEPVLNTSILKRAKDKGLVEYNLLDLRQFGEGKHQVVDDRPFGGGPGMVLKPDVLAKAWQAAAKPQTANHKPYTILMSASGFPFKQSKAQKFTQFDHLMIVCGHYEGVDQRFVETYVDEEISIGDYVLTGGELPAMVVIDATVRLIPKVLKKEAATEDESFAKLNAGILEYPQYTRPESFENSRVPKVLLSGNHQQIAHWRKVQSLEKTQKIRPDLLKS